MRILVNVCAGVVESVSVDSGETDSIECLVADDDVMCADEDRVEANSGGDEYFAERIEVKVLPKVVDEYYRVHDAKMDGLDRAADLARMEKSDEPPAEEDGGDDGKE